jgi:hypothetical protein
MVGFTIGMASLLFVLLGEIIPVQIKNEVNGLMTLLNSGSAFAAFMVFHVMMDNIGMSGTFWVFSTACFLTVIYGSVWLPETKGESLTNIERKLIVTNLNAKV